MFNIEFSRIILKVWLFLSAITTILGGLAIIVGIIIGVDVNPGIIIFCEEGITTIGFWFLLNKCKLGFLFIIISHISYPDIIFSILIIIVLYNIMKFEGYWDELT
jgi:hypothetical protein